jgi:hypothetical protein
MTTEELVAKIGAAFEPGAGLDPEAVVEHWCEQCEDVARAFAGRTWPEISAEAIDSHYSSLPLLTPAAFRQILPAYMVRGLQRPPDFTGLNDVSEFTTYMLLPEEVSPWWTDRVKAFSPEQNDAVYEFVLEMLARRADYFAESDLAAMSHWAEGRGRRTKG